MNSAIDLLEGYNRQGDKTRIDQQVAYGLRARAHLYMGMWQEAYNDADKAMEGYTPYTKEEVSKPAFMIYPIITGCGELTFLYLW